MSSTVIPQVFMAINSPAMGLELPGPVATVVTPPRTAKPYSGSRGYTPSMARSWGVTGSEVSLPSSPGKPMAVS